MEKKKKKKINFLEGKQAPKSHMDCTYFRWLLESQSMETSIGERSALIKPLDGYGVFRSVSCRCKRVYRDFYRESKLKRHRARLYAVN